MTEQNACKRRIVLHNGVMHGFIVLNEMIPTVLVAEEAKRLILADGFAVSRKIHAENKEAVFCQEHCKIVIAFNVFSHSVNDLNAGSGLIRRPDPITYITNSR